MVLFVDRTMTGVTKSYQVLPRVLNHLFRQKCFCLIRVSSYKQLTLCLHQVCWLSAVTVAYAYIMVSCDDLTLDDLNNRSQLSHWQNQLA